MNTIYCQIAAVLPLLIGMAYPAHALPPAPVTGAPASGIRVLVNGIHHGGNLLYNYKVVNDSNTRIHSVIIGSKFDSVKDSEYPQLLRLPLGWAYGEVGEIGTEIILAPGSTSQPTGWKASVYGQQGTALYYLEWDTFRGYDGLLNDIHPGQTLSGFSVTVPSVHTTIHPPHYSLTAPDEMYVRGHFKIGVIDTMRNFQDIWGQLEREDTAPPILTISLSPDTLWPPNGKLVPVTATITVKDDYDPQPEIILESITANETATASDAPDAQPGTDDRQFQLKAKRTGDNLAGRIYTVTYSATDASGNKATASATVTVPHDQGK
jgi:hypothetical protein